MKRAFRFALLLILLAPGCGSMRPPGGSVDAELNRLAGLARAAYTSGDTARAVSLYQQVLARARTIDNAPAVADALFNLALAYYAAGDWVRVAERARQARMTYEAGGGDPGAAWLLEVRALMKQREPARADELAVEALNTLVPGAQRDVRYELHLLRAEAAMEQQRPALAAERLGDAAAELPRKPAPATRALHDRLDGDLARAENRFAEAAAHYDRAAAGHGRAGDYRSVALALRDAGQAYAADGRAADAADRLFRAGQSLHGQGYEDKARACLAEALKQVQRAADAALQARIEMLLSEMSR